MTQSHRLKREGIAALFRDKTPMFRKGNWLPSALLILIVTITLILYPPAGLVAAPLQLLFLAIPVAIVNGVCEELLWRGLYVMVFPQNPVLCVVYPSLGRW